MGERGSQLEQKAQWGEATQEIHHLGMVDPWLHRFDHLDFKETIFNKKKFLPQFIQQTGEPGSIFHFFSPSPLRLS